mgnify:CR=1 FL=1
MFNVIHKERQKTIETRTFSIQKMIKSIRNYIEQHKENTLYLTIWFVVFTIPIMAMLLRITDTYEPFNWNHVISAWKILALFFIVFLIHNIFLLPKIVYQKKRKQK